MIERALVKAMIDVDLVVLLGVDRYDITVDSILILQGTKKKVRHRERKIA